MKHQISCNRVELPFKFQTASVPFKKYMLSYSDDLILIIHLPFPPVFQIPALNSPVPQKDFRYVEIHGYVILIFSGPKCLNSSPLYVRT